VSLHRDASAWLVRFGAASVLSVIGLCAVFVRRYLRSVRPATQGEGDSHNSAVKEEGTPEQLETSDKTSNSPEGQVDLLGFLKDAAVPLIALSAAFGYVIVRPAFDGFYSALGLRPEDVGINEAQMLSLGSVVGLLYGVTIVLAILLLSWLYRTLKRLGPTWRFVIALTLVLVGWALTRVHTIYFFLPQSDTIQGVLLRYFLIESAVALFIVGFSSMLGVAIGLLATKLKWQRSTKSPQERKRSRIYIALAVGLIAVLTAAGVGRLVGNSAGKDLLSYPGTSFSTKYSILVPLLSESTTPVYVIPLTGDKLGLCVRGKGAPHIDIYLLGRGNGGAFVLVFQTTGEESNGRVVFLPSADYSLISANFDFSDSFGGCHDRGVYNDPSFP
jgi:hypothetical protein